MRAGVLRDYVKLQRPVEAVDATGAIARTWADVASVHASISQTTGREYFASGGEVSEGNIRIRVRELPEHPDFDPSWRIVNVDTNEQYDIINIVPNRLRNDLMVACRLGGVKRS
jgi:SPP1 family predicted phage head-tail adaptor